MKFKLTNERRFIAFIIIVFVILCFMFFTNQDKPKIGTKAVIKPVSLLINQDKMLHKETVQEIKKPELPELPEYKIPLTDELQKYTWDLCLENGLSYELVLALIKIESQFNTQKVSRNSDRTTDLGLTQINDKYMHYHCKLVGVKNFDPFNPEKSIELTVKLLKHYKDYWTEKGCSEEDTGHIILNCYNQGLEGFIKYVNKTHRIDSIYSNTILKNKMYLEKYGEFEK
jgi:hypothetical protein